MSEQEKKTTVSDAGSVVVVKQTASSHHKTSYRPNELPDDTDRRHKWTTVPAASSVAEPLKHVPEGSTAKEIVETKDIKDLERAMTSDHLKHEVVKKLSSNIKKQHPSESIALSPVEAEVKKIADLPPSQPIPVEVQSVVSKIDDVVAEIKATKSSEEDSISKEVTELRIPETKMAKQHSEWSDEEEASGLPRSQSRTSRVSRVVRQFFCCGVSYEAPSEYNTPSRRRHYSHAI